MGNNGTTKRTLLDTIRRRRDATLPTNARCCKCGGRVYARNRTAQKAINETAGRGVKLPCHRCGG